VQSKLEQEAVVTDNLRVAAVLVDREALRSLVQVIVYGEIRFALPVDGLVVSRSELDCLDYHGPQLLD
jgi:hypothetical protein